jgi:hypothetical protein
MKPNVKIALFVVFFIALAVIFASLYMFNLKHTDMAKARPDFIISASALQNEFDLDESAASKKYINKILEVTGTISSVEPSSNDVFNITLSTGNELSSVICTFPSIIDPSKYKAGNEITLRGECSGFLMDVLLNNCAVIHE